MRKIIMEWTPLQGKRRMGRQKTRWEDETIKSTGTAWGRDGRVRDRWRKVGEVYAQRWTH